jgi:hypothetical protein
MHKTLDNPVARRVQGTQQRLVRPAYRGACRSFETDRIACVVAPVYKTGRVSSRRAWPRRTMLPTNPSHKPATNLGIMWGVGELDLFPVPIEFWLASRTGVALVGVVARFDRYGWDENRGASVVDTRQTLPGRFTATAKRSADYW